MPGVSDATPQGHRVPLPSGIEGTIEVYRDGVLAQAGVDFHREGDELVFRVPLNCGRRTSLLGKLQLSLLGIGLYEKIDKIDVHETLPTGAFRLHAELTAVPDPD